MSDTHGEQSNLSRSQDDKKLSTIDKQVTIVSTSGDYHGNINLNLANVQVNRVSDLFIKSDIAFLPLYHANIMGQQGREVLINVKDIAVVIPHDQITSSSPELRKDAAVTVKLKYGLGNLSGNVNLLGETQQVDRISDLLNFPGKKWLILYDVSYKEQTMPVAIINLEFISLVED